MRNFTYICIMIQVIERVEDILLYLASNRDREVPLSEIADSLNINRATCANILKSLKETGFVEQSNYRQGYCIGNTIYTIAGVENDSDRMFRPILSLIDNLCKQVNENVMLVVLKNDKRIIIHSAKANHQIEAKIIDVMKAWPATTAKVIIAQYGIEKLNSYLKLVGMPGKDWPEVKNKTELLEKLSEIRSQKCYTVINQHFACMAAPIFKSGEVVASIGYYLPDIRLTDENKVVLETKLLETIRKAESLL